MKPSKKQWRKATKRAHRNTMMDCAVWLLLPTVVIAACVFALAANNWYGVVPQRGAVTVNDLGFVVLCAIPFIASAGAMIVLLCLHDGENRHYLKDERGQYIVVRLPLGQEEV
jgi:hypothetical protein